MNTLVMGRDEENTFPIDIYSKLSNDRILFLSGEINDQVAADITATLFLKDCEGSKDEKITIFINSEGGDIRSVFMIYDMMQILDCPIETICVGSAFDEVALLLASGTPGMRFATPNATICISQVIKNEYYRANLEDAKTVLQRMQRDNKNFISALANKTGKKVIDLTKDLEIKKFLTSKQAQTYGIIDKVIGVK